MALSMEDTKYHIITFRSGLESFFSMTILFYLIWTGLMLACIGKYTYSHYQQYFYVLLIFIIFLFAILMAYPSSYKYIYYRWIVFKYNRTTIFSVDMERKSFTYMHDDEEISFAADDVEKWSWGCYVRMNTIFIKIVRIRLKNGKKIEISSGIGDVDKFLQENWEQLGIPKGTYRYGDDFKSLQSYIKRINH